MANLTKPELIERLTELGVTLRGDELVPELKQLLADNEPKPEGDNTDAVPVEPAPERSKATGVYDAVAVKDAEGKLVRVYSEADHGNDYKELAKEFSDHNQGTTIEAYFPPPAPKPAPEDTEKVSVYHPSGDIHRTFSLRDHGSDYKKLAQEFMDTHADEGFRLGSLPE